MIPMRWLNNFRRRLAHAVVVCGIAGLFCPPLASAACAGEADADPPGHGAIPEPAAQEGNEAFHAGRATGPPRLLHAPADVPRSQADRRDPCQWAAQPRPVAGATSRVFYAPLPRAFPPGDQRSQHLLLGRLEHGPPAAVLGRPAVGTLRRRRLCRWPQPVFSGVHFFATFPVIPYKIGLDGTYNLLSQHPGLLRPGGTAPAERANGCRSSGTPRCWRRAPSAD